MSKLRNWAIGIGLAAAVAIPATALATSASAATSAPAVVTAHHNFPGPELLRGRNILELQFNGSTFKYRVRFFEYPIAPETWAVYGTLHDGYEPFPIYLPVHGVQFDNVVVFQVNYPTSGPDKGDQGTRQFIGTIDNSGNVSGTWSETGTEGGSGTWDLLFPV